MAKTFDFKEESVRELIENYLAQGGLESGKAIPSERRLAELFSVNRATIHHALLQMEGENLIEKRRGLKYYLSAPKYIDDATLSGSFTAQYRAQGKEPDAKVYYFELREADFKTSRLMSVKLGTPVYELRRVRSINGDPVTIDKSYLVSELCPGLLDYDFNGQNSLYDRLEKTYGLKLTRHQQDIRTTVLTEEEAELLEANQGDPAFYGVGVSRTDDGRIVERSITITRADRMTIVYTALIENNIH